MKWQKYKLKDLVDNFSVRARDYGGSEGLDFLGVSNDDGIVKSKSAAEHKGEEYKIIEKGCFAYNPYRVNIGSIAYHNEDSKGLISPAYVIFKTKPNSIKDNLLFKFLKSAEGLRQIRFHGRGTVRQALRFEDLCKIEISIPSFEEQELVIKNLENIEIETNEVNIELTHQLSLVKQLRQAFLREAMQGKLVKSTNTTETGQQLLAKIKVEKAQLIKDKKLKKEKPLPPITEEEIPFEIPVHWAWCRLGDVCNKIGSGSTPKGSNYSEIGKPFFRSQNIHDNGLVYNDIKFVSDAVQKQMNGTVVIANDILLNITGGSMGRCALVPNDFGEGNVSQHVCIIRPLSLNNVFIHKLILSPYFQKLIFSSTTGAGREGLPKYNLEQFLFPLPPLHEQEQIVAKLEKLMAFCDGLEESIKESQGYNQMLLQQVLREALQSN